MESPLSEEQINKMNETLHDATKRVRQQAQSATEEDAKKAAPLINMLKTVTDRYVNDVKRLKELTDNIK